MPDLSPKSMTEKGLNPLCTDQSIDSYASDSAWSILCTSLRLGSAVNLRSPTESSSDCIDTGNTVQWALLQVDNFGNQITMSFPSSHACRNGQQGSGE